jgi:hypothetical protein
MKDFVKNQIRAAKAKKTSKNGGPSTRARPGGGPDNSGLEKKLSELLTADDLEGAAEVWRDGMKANKFAWSQLEQGFVDTGFPDWDVRERMAAKVAAYKEGLPVAKQMIISGTFDDFGKMISKMQGSPEALRVLQSMGGELPAIQDESLQKTSESNELGRKPADDASGTGKT